MPLTNIKLRKKTNSQTTSYTGAAGEVTIDTDKQVIVVHDGSNAGGFPLAQESRVNAAFSSANTVSATATAASSYANSAYLAANASVNFIAIGTANSSSSYANSAFGVANSASSYANGAFSAANTKFSASGGTISGDVIVSGNLTVGGNVTTITATNLSIQDNMIYLNDNNTVTNPDLGIAGNYNDGTYHHAGIFRDATDGTWKFFYNYSPEPDASPYIDTTHATFRYANITANLITDVATIRGYDPINHANAAYAAANTAATSYITPRVVVISDGTTVTMNANTTDIATQSNSQTAGTLTIAAPTGTPANGQKLIFRLLSANTQTFSWDTSFQGSTDLALPTSSSGSNKYDYMGFIYNSTATKWQLLAKNFGF